MRSWSCHQRYLRVARSLMQPVYLPTGYVEEMVVKAERVGPSRSRFVPPGHHLGAYAIDLAKRIRALDVSKKER